MNVHVYVRDAGNCDVTDFVAPWNKHTMQRIGGYIQHEYTIEITPEEDASEEYEPGTNVVPLRR